MFQNERLFSQLKVAEGKRQFVISGETQDLFMQNMYDGLGDRKTSLGEYLKTQGYEIIVVIEKLNDPRFLSPDMERRFREIVRGQSVDPQAESAGRNTRAFVPKNVRSENQNNSVAPPSEQIQRAEQAAVEVTNAGSNTEQNFLDSLTRLLESSTKSVVIFFNPENMWTLKGNPTENDLHKLDTIVGWSRITVGHPDNASILVVNPMRLQEFNTYADRYFYRTTFTRNITLTKPGKRELEAFLMRFTCRYGYYGQLDKIAATAYAKHLTLREFSNRVGDFVRHNQGTRCLNGLFADDSQAKTLDELVAEINGLIGLTELKKEVNKIIAEAQYDREQRRRGNTTSPLSYHMFFLGNPGTGKTMVARLLGQIFWALELRPSQTVVEIAYSDIISSYNEGESGLVVGLANR